MKRVVGTRRTTSYTSSLVSAGGVCGKKLEIGSVVLLDGKHEVTVKSQGFLRAFTIVQMGSKTFEVDTDRLAEKD